jgi:hypothetical protein
MRSSGKQTIAFPYFVPDKQQKQIASGSHRIAAFERRGLTPIGHDDIVRFYIGQFMRLRWTDHGKHHLP